MGDYELHFAEEGRAPFGLRLRLPNEWTHKTTKDLVAHFIETYNKARSEPLTGAYGLVDVRTGRFYADDASLADVAHDAPLSVARRDPPAPPGEDDVEAEYALDDAGSDEVDAVDDEEPLEDLIAIGAFGGGYQRSRARLRAALRRRRVSVADLVAEAESDEEDASVASSSSSEESEDDEEDYRRAPPPQQRKDWGALNYKKALCPDMVAGRKCPHGAACGSSNTSSHAGHTSSGGISSTNTTRSRFVEWKNSADVPGTASSFSTMVVHGGPGPGTPVRAAEWRRGACFGTTSEACAPCDARDPPQ